MNAQTGPPLRAKSSKTIPTPIDRKRFLAKSNASLKRIERSSLLILAFGGGIGLLFNQKMGIALLVGGLLAMLHFRSLHRMFQKRMLDPASWLKTKFFYSSTLFFIVCFFFLAIQWKEISTAGVISGFFLMTGAVFFESTRK